MRSICVSAKRFPAATLRQASAGDGGLRCNNPSLRGLGLNPISLLICAVPRLDVDGVGLRS
jgi:hypothetical protein